MNQMTKWLFDTTYLLPFQGYPVDIKNLDQDLETLFLSNREDIAISACSLIECRFLAYSQYKKHKDKKIIDRSTKAIRKILDSKILTVINTWENSQANIYADDLRKKGMKDPLDCWIFGTAKAEDRVLISEEKAARKFIKNDTDWKSLEIMNWKEFKYNILD